MKKIRCGVIGLGFFGEYNVDALKSIPIADVVAVCTRKEDRLKEVADKYEIPKRYFSHHELLEDKNIDMVSVVTHAKDHSLIAIDAIRAKKHIFLEKPMANSIEECSKIIDELKNTDKFLMVGHICRFDNVYALAKDEIDSGSLGKILSIHAKRNLNKDFTERGLKKISALFGDGIHDIDLMLWYTGAAIKSVYAQTSNSRPEFPFDDIGWALFRFDNDCIGVIESIWCLPSDTPQAIDAQMEIIGEKGAIYIDNSGANFRLVTGKGIKYPQSTYWPKVREERRGFLRDELEYFLKCILKNKKPSVITPEESMKAVYAIKMAEESARLNKVIHF